MKQPITRLLQSFLRSVTLSLICGSLILAPVARATPQIQPETTAEIDEFDVTDFFEDAEADPAAGVSPTPDTDSTAEVDAANAVEPSPDPNCTASIEKYAKVSRNRALLIPAITVLAAPVGTFILAGMGAQIANLASPNSNGWAALGGVIMGLLVGTAGSAITFSIMETKAIIQAVQATKIRRILHASKLVVGQNAVTTDRFDQRSLRTFYRYLEKSNQDRLPNQILSERTLAMRVLALNSTGALCDGSLKKKAPRDRHTRKNVLRKLVVTPKELRRAI